MTTSSSQTWNCTCSIIQNVEGSMSHLRWKLYVIFFLFPYAVLSAISEAIKVILFEST